MRVAALYDIHGNLPALEAVLDEVRRANVDRIVIGGDVVPGPMPVETIESLLAIDRPVLFIRGNGEGAVLAVIQGQAITHVPEQFRGAIEWLAQQLRPQHQELLSGWPATVEIKSPALGDVLFCHATPRNDREIFTRLTAEDRLLPIFAEVPASLVVCGHTHMQFDRMVGRTRVVNAGSVGMPFGDPGAYWLLLDADAQLRRTSYDLAAAAERIKATNYPQAADFAAWNVLHPPSEQAMLDAFGRAELK